MQLADAEEQEPRPPASGAVPLPLQADLAAFRSRLSEGGLREALQFLNARTPHRFTGVFRFDGDMLRSVELVDKWDPQVQRADDIPVASAYCAHLQRTGEPLEVEDGGKDARVPWMASSPVVSYCGALIRDGEAEPWGALCHFDHAPCEAKSSDLPLIHAAASLIHGAAEDAS